MNWAEQNICLDGVNASAWCMMCAFAFLIFPNFNQTVDPNWFDAPTALFEIATGSWLFGQRAEATGTDGERRSKWTID